MWTFSEENWQNKLKMQCKNPTILCSISSSDVFICKDAFVNDERFKVYVAYVGSDQKKSNRIRTQVRMATTRAYISIMLSLEFSSSLAPGQRIYRTKGTQSSSAVIYDNNFGLADIEIACILIC